MNTEYAVCVKNQDYPASLEVGKIYRTLPTTAQQSIGYFVS